MDRAVSSDPPHDRDDSLAQCSYNICDLAVVSVAAEAGPRDFALAAPPSMTHTEALAERYQSVFAARLLDYELAGLDRARNSLLARLEMFGSGDEALADLAAGPVDVTEAGPFRTAEGVVFKWYEFKDRLSEHWLLPDLGLRGAETTQSAHSPEQYPSDAVRVLTFVSADGELEFEVLHNIHTIRDAMSNVVCSTLIPYHSNEGARYSHLRDLIEGVHEKPLFEGAAEDEAAFLRRDLNRFRREQQLGIRGAREECETDHSGIRRFLYLQLQKPTAEGGIVEIVSCSQRWQISLTDDERLTLQLVSETVD